MVRLLDGGRELVLLSPRETQVLSLTAEGHPEKEVAYRLSIQVCTVKKIKREMRQGLGFSGNMLLAWAVSRPEVFHRLPVSPEPFRMPVQAIRAAVPAPLRAAS